MALFSQPGRSLPESIPTTHAGRRWIRLDSRLLSHGLKPPSDLTRAIAAAPDDDGPRLAYADWLDAGGTRRGAERAEIIRVQCELYRMPPPVLVRCVQYRAGHLFPPLAACRLPAECLRCQWEHAHGGRYRWLTQREADLGAREAVVERIGGDLQVAFERGFAVLEGRLDPLRGALDRVLELDGFAWPVATDVAPVSQYDENAKGYALYRLHGSPVEVRTNSYSSRHEVPDDVFSRLRDSGWGSPEITQYGLEYMLWLSKAEATHAVSYALLVLALGWPRP